MSRSPALRSLFAAGLAVLAACSGATDATTALDARGGRAEGGAVVGQRLYGVTTSNRILTFGAGSTCSISGEAKITGLQADESILGIDVRPATGGLYALGSSSRLYLVDPATGAASAVGSGAPLAILLEGTAFGFDFNPTVDRIRITSDAGQNLRANPNDGALVAMQPDGDLAYAALDANGGVAPRVVASAYTNPDTDPATGTTLYDIDLATGNVVTQVPPNAGTLNTVGALGVRSNELAGFDIDAANVAYAALKPVGGGQAAGRCGNTTLYTIDLTTGAATDVGAIGTDAPLRGLAAALR